jgi:enamine deaminase RidA (YjgF/YER057c/UK114 family)
VARDIIRTGDAPSSSIFSQAVRAGGLIFVSGQAPIDPGHRQNLRGDHPGADPAEPD